jgi:hypothetical protein
MQYILHSNCLVLSSRVQYSSSCVPGIPTTRGIPTVRQDTYVVSPSTARNGTN